jgi:hypothetical protein
MLQIEARVIWPGCHKRILLDAQFWPQLRSVHLSWPEAARRRFTMAIETRISNEAYERLALPSLAIDLTALYNN